MATKKIISKSPPRLSVVRRERSLILADVCALLEAGSSLQGACALVPDAATTTVLDWIGKYPEMHEQYTRARQIGYSLLADEIVELSDKTHEWITIQELDPDGNPVVDAAGTPKLNQVLMPLSADVIAHKRVQIDTRKWMLSKMLPKIYGDKVVQEHTGANGGPIALAAVDLKGLSDDELQNMKLLLAKAGKPI